MPVDQGVPAVEKLPRTVAELVENQATRRPESPAIQWLDGSAIISYAELRDLTQSFSIQLSGTVAPGQRVALIGPSGPEFSLAALAIMISHSVAPLDNRLTTHELDFYLGLIQPVAIVVVGQAPETLGQCPTAQTIPQISFPVPSSAPRHRPVVEAARSGLTDSAEAAVFLTSGSTGTPKVVPLTHRNIMASAAQICSSLSLSDSDRGLVLWAQFHVGGIVDLLIAPVLAGSTVINGGLFSVGKLVQGLTHLKPTWIQFVPATLAEVIRTETKGIEFTTGSRLRFVRCVAAELSPELWLAAEEFFGVPVVTTYGMTEAGPLITSTSLVASERTVGSVGKPCGTRIRIVDEQGRTVPTGVIGEITIAGPNVFAGYENNQPGSDAPGDNCWFITGDLGRFDDNGNLYLEGRAGDQINVGGAKLSPIEVERVLRTHPTISDAIVFGVDHTTLGEVPVAVYSGPTETDPNELYDLLSDELSGYKVPRDFMWVPSLPLTKSRKVDRNATRSLYLGRHFDQPRPGGGPLDDLISRIWSQELDIDQPPRNKSFGLAGGDSLSAIRLISELHSHGFDVSKWVETDLIKMTLPDMIQRLRRQAESAHVSKIEVVTIQQSGTSRPSTHENYENLLSVGDFRSSLLAAGSSLERKILVEKALNYLTSSELTKLIELTEHLKDSRTPASVISEVGTSPWTRKVIAPSINHYVRDHFVGSGQTVIAFTGHLARLMMPISHFLALLPQSIDSVVVAFDLERAHYRPKPGTQLRDLFRALAEVGGFEPQRSVALGTSSGALPALAFSMYSEGIPVGMVGPDLLSRHGHLSHEIDRSRAHGNGPGNIRILTGWMKRDLQGAREIRKLFAAAQWRRFPTKSHNPLERSRRVGMAHNFVSWLTFGNDRSRDY